MVSAGERVLISAGARQPVCTESPVPASVEAHAQVWLVAGSDPENDPDPAVGLGLEAGF